MSTSHLNTASLGSLGRAVRGAIAWCRLRILFILRFKRLKRNRESIRKSTPPQHRVTRVVGRAVRGRAVRGDS
jgi:hypothetical protein